MNKLLYPVAYVLMLSFASVAQAYTNYHQSEPPTHNSSAQQSDPVDDIKTTLDKLQQFSSNTDTASPMMLRSFIENEIIPHFSFEDMSHWITGPYARRMTQEDKDDFLVRLKEAFLNSMANHLGNLENIKERVRFYPTRYRGYNEAIVGSKVYRDSNYPAKLDFRMRRIGPDWKIVDVRANGTSAVVYYRQHFIAELRQYNRSPGQRKSRDNETAY